MLSQANNRFISRVLQSNQLAGEGNYGGIVAEDPSNELEVMPVDAGFAFRTEMFLNNFIMGYWKPIVSGLALFLAIILVYGNYQNWYKGGQFETSDEIAKVLRQFETAHPNTIAPGSLLKPETLYYSQPLAIDGDEELRTHCKIAADALEAIALAGSGASAAQAYFLASEFHRVLGDAAARTAALELGKAQLGSDGQGTLDLAVAASIREEGDIDGTLAALGDISTTSESAFAQQWALVERSRHLMDLGRADEAAADLQALLVAHPTGATAELAEGELESMGISTEADAPETSAPESTEPENTVE